jgi:hypothetical protein
MDSFNKMFNLLATHVINNSTNTGDFTENHA